MMGDGATAKLESGTKRDIVGHEHEISRENRPAARHGG